MDKLKIEGYKPLGDMVFDSLRKAIVTGDLKPGERIMEAQIADRLGVSRTPVREAIKKLEKEKLIEMVPRKGAYVARITSKDVLDVLELRKLLEGFSALLASERMTSKEKQKLEKISKEFAKCIESGDKEGMIQKDNEFHSLIFSSTRNEKLMDIIKSLQDQFQRFREVYFNEFHDYGSIMLWHEKICSAIKEGRPQDASSAASSHVAAIEEIVLEWVEKGENND